MQQRFSTDYTEGRAYGRPGQSHDPQLCEVGPGTPCGEFMRRYWHPVWVRRNWDHDRKTFASSART